MSGKETFVTSRLDPPGGRRRAFTLVELLVVVAIIVILLSIILATVKSAPEIARRMACSVNLKQLVEGCHAWAKDHQDKFPSGQPTYGLTTVDMWDVYNVWVGPDVIDPEQGAWLQHGVLAANRIVTPNIMYCPSWRYPYIQFGKANPPDCVDAASGPIWPVWDDPGIMPAGQTAMQTTYHYRSSFGNDHRQQPNKRKTTICKPYDAVIADAFSDPYDGRGLEAHHEVGCNVAHMGGHVKFKEDTEGNIPRESNFSRDETAVRLVWEQVLNRE